MSDVQSPRDKSLSNLRPWQPGQSGNPKGKPKGAIDRLRRNFGKTLRAHFDLHGESALDRCCDDDPTGYLRVVASVIKENGVNQPSGPVVQILIAADERDV